MTRQVHDDDGLVRRIEVLEARARRGRRLTTAAVCLLAAATLSAQVGAPRTQSAAAFVVRDAAGVPRARLGMTGETGDVPSLTLFDERGHLRVALAVEADGPMLNLFGVEGNPRVVVGERGTTSFVVVRDAEGAPRAAMAVQADGTPSLYLLDEEMNPLYRQPQQR